MRFAGKIFSAAALTVAVTITLISGVSCAVPAAAPQANRPPVIKQSTGPSSVMALTEGQFSCTAIDPDGDTLTYKWTADNGTFSGSGSSVTWLSPAAMGKYKITVTVSDGKGGEATEVQETRVILNADGSVTPDAPVVLKLAFPSQEVVQQDKRIRAWFTTRVECLIEGADTKDLKYTWSGPNGTLFAAKGMNLADGTASKVDWRAPGAGGNYVVNVVVTDGSGNVAKGAVNFKVVCCGNE